MVETLTSATVVQPTLLSNPPVDLVIVHKDLDGDKNYKPTFDHLENQDHSTKHDQWTFEVPVEIVQQASNLEVVLAVAAMATDPTVKIDPKAYRIEVEMNNVELSDPAQPIQNLQPLKITGTVAEGFVDWVLKASLKDGKLDGRIYRYNFEMTNHTQVPGVLAIRSIELRIKR